MTLTKEITISMIEDEIQTLEIHDLLRMKNIVDKLVSEHARKRDLALLADARKAATELAGTYGFSLADLTKNGESRLAARRGKSPSKPLYVDPDDFCNAWSGKGRQPEWLRAEIEAGKTLQDFLI